MAVWLLPGQGAQKPGMGAGLEVLPEVVETFAVASRELGVDVAYLATEAGADEVNDAFNAQALTMAVSVGIGRALMARGAQPDAMIGFSLGQISALVLADVLPMDKAFALLKVRSQAMARACADNPGGMIALRNADVAQAEALVAEVMTQDVDNVISDAADESAADGQAQGAVLVAANHNSPVQTVISGTETALARAEEVWTAAGNRCTRLNTAGAFHSPLMAPAAEAVAQACAGLTFSEPRVPLLCNTDARPFTAAEAAERLSRQVKQPVFFQESVQALIAQGATTFLEVGYGKVLTGLVKRIDGSVARAKVGSVEELEAYVSGDAGRR